MRELSIYDIAKYRLAYIKRLEAENAELKELLEVMKKSKSSYWNRGSLLKAASEEEES